jgi:phosphoribosyl 1,2-cyclic phosphate phosphodiesterase
VDLILDSKCCFKCQKVDAIFFTHEHADHTAGIDDIRPFNFKQGEIPIYAHQRVIDNLKVALNTF